MKLLVILALGVLASQAVPLNEVDSDDVDVLNEFAVGYNKFTSNVYTELSKHEAGNFLVCPMSVQIVLALVHDGARGATAHQLSNGCNLPENKEKIRKIFKALSPALKGNEDYVLQSANKMYVKDGYELSEGFKSTAVDAFQAGIENIDFLQNQEAAVTMNKWVEEQTHDKITNLISPDDLSNDTFAVLINAMYFHGKWVTEFNKDATQLSNFYTSKSSHVAVEMMDITTQYNYYESPELNAKFLEIPYAGNDVSMTFVLPNDIEGLPELEKNMENVIATSNNEKHKVHVTVPKFKMETTIQFKKILEALGMVLPFLDSADFGEISASSDLLKIDKVVQKAFIEVEEKGTTAAAATAVIIGFARSGHSLVPRPKVFKADHPFIYYIKSKKAGVLFIGRYVTK